MTHDDLARKIDEVINIVGAYELRLATVEHQQNRMAESFNKRITLLEQEESDNKKRLARMESTLEIIRATTAGTSATMTDLRDLLKVWARHSDDGK